MPTPVAGEEQAGPVLSLMAARTFDFLFLFFTPHTQPNAEATSLEVSKRYPKCQVMTHQLPVSDPKDYSSLMGRLARQVRDLMRMAKNTENHVCISSGTAEMRAAWFLLVAVGVLPATLLQVGTPAEPLFGAANVKEVRLDQPDWKSLRDLVMPLDYFLPPALSLPSRLKRRAEPDFSGIEAERTSVGSAPVYHRRVAEFAYAELPALPPEQFPELDDALRELQIYIGSAVMRFAAERIATVASTDVPILILGETGTGKELFAKLAHRLSERRLKDLVPVNCAAIPKELMESYLFGHVKGAFTGASSNQIGKFERAHESTLFLDEIAELTPDAQAKLLRVLQDGNVEPLGSHQLRHVDVRVISATNRNLQDEMATGKFREDLYYRLKGVEVSLPALQQRREEIPLLAIALLDRINQKFLRQRSLTKTALARLADHDWPGNVRELEGVLRESVLFAKRDALEAEDLMIKTPATSRDCFTSLPVPEPGFNLKAFLAEVRAHLIHKALSKCEGNQSQAADLLGITRQAVSDFINSSTDKPS